MPPLMALLPTAAAGAGAGAIAGGSTAAALGNFAGMEALAAGTAGVTGSIVPATLATSLATASSWLAPAMTGLSLLGTGVSALGQIQQGQTEAAIMEANAATNRMEASSIQQQAKNESLKLSRQARKMIGTQANAMAGAGLDITSGSPLEIMAQTAGNFAEDIEWTGYSGDLAAASKNYTADIYDWAAPQRREAGIIGGLGTLGSGLSNLYRVKKFGLTQGF